MSERISLCNITVHLHTSIEGEIERVGRGKKEERQTKEDKEEESKKGRLRLRGYQI